MAADGPAMLAAAVRAACLANAPRRTIQAVAVGVARVYAHEPSRATQKVTGKAQPATQSATVPGEYVVENMPALVEALRTARSAQRKRKKERRKAAQAERKAQSATEAEGGRAQSGPAVGEQQPAATASPGVPVASTDPILASFGSQNLPLLHLTRHDGQSSIESSGSVRSFNTIRSMSHVGPPGLSAAPAATSPRTSERNMPHGVPAPPNQPDRPGSRSPRRR